MNEKPNKISYQWLTILALIIAVAAWRAFMIDGSTTLIANFTPIGAIALFAGAHFQNKAVRYIFPLAILFISDVFLASDGMTEGLLYPGWVWVYLAFSITIFFGKKISNFIRLWSVFSASIASALVHWLLSDFGYWLTGGINIISNAPFEKTAQDLLLCLSLGFPFFLKLATSTVLYSFLMFGFYALLCRLTPRAKTILR